MPIQLTPAQENLTRELVKLDNAEQLDDEFAFFETFGGSHLQIHKASRQIECSWQDLKVLHAAGILRVTREGEHTASCSLRPEAADAVRQDFGGSRRRRVLHAIYDLADGKPLNGVLEADIAKRAKLSVEDLHAVFCTLASEKLVSSNSGSGKGPVMYLEAAGIREVQNAGQSGPPLVGGTFIHVKAEGSAVNFGAGNTASIHHHANAPISLKEIQEQNNQMLAQHEAIRIAIEDLTAAMKAGLAKDDPSVLDRVVKLVDAGKSLMDFGAAVLAAGQSLRSA